MAASATVEPIQIPGGANADDALHDLGILFVHGIGQSRQGETLQAFGEPLRACLERVLVPAQGQDPQVQVQTATLKPTGSEPATSRIDIRHAQALGAKPNEKPPRQSWLMAEAWWAEKFSVPTYSDLSNWSFKVLPWTLIAHFDRRLRRLGFRFFGAFGGARSGRRIAAGLAQWSGEGLSLAIAMALSPLIVLALAVIGLLALVPIGFLREGAAKVQRLLAATIGDSYVFMQHPLASAAIVGCVREHISWMSRRCKRIAVIAHSQGAAVAHAALRSDDTERCELFVTFGSGLAKLSEMERIDANPAGGALLMWASAGALAATIGLFTLPIAWWLDAAPTLPAHLPAVNDPWLVHAVIGVAIIASGVLSLGLAVMRGADKQRKNAAAAVAPSMKGAYVFAFFGTLMALLEAWWIRLPGWDWPSGPLGTLAVALGLTGAYGLLQRWHAMSGRSFDPQEQSMRDRLLFLDRFALKNHPDTLWFDFYAGADPVSNGALLDVYQPKTERGAIHSAGVTNVDSAVMDHTTYWQATDDFVRRVAEQSSVAAGLSTQRFDRVNVGRRRRFRAACLAVARTVLALFAVGIAWMHREVTPMFNEVAGAVLHPKNEGVWHSIATFAKPNALALLAWVLAYSAIRALWKRWDADDIQQAFANRPFARWSGPLSGFAHGTALALVALAAGGWGWPVAAATAAAWLLVALVFKASMPARHAFDRWSSSGDPTWLRNEEVRRLAEQVARAESCNDVDELDRLGHAARYLDEDLAHRALNRALALGSKTAAPTLASLWADRAKDASLDAAARAQAETQARSALERGAAQGDAFSARLLGNRLYDNEPAQAVKAFRRALRLGDDAAAHSLGLLYEKMDSPRADAVYGIGARRRDRLSMLFLAERYARRARAYPPPDDATRNALVDKAVPLFEAAYALGETSGAESAGNLLRDVDRLEQARTHYERAAQRRSAHAQMMLGDLALKIDADAPLARKHYARAMVLDHADNYIYLVQARLGELAQAEGHLEVAMRMYGLAINAANAGSESVEAALALARLQIQRNASDDDIARTFKRALSLSAARACEAFARWLLDTHQAPLAKEIATGSTESFTPAALVMLGRAIGHADSAVAMQLFERAWQNNPPYTEAVIAMDEIGVLSEAATETLLAALDPEKIYVIRGLLYQADQANRFVLADRIRRQFGLPDAPKPPPSVPIVTDKATPVNG